MRLRRRCASIAASTCLQRWREARPARMGWSPPPLLQLQRLQQQQQQRLPRLDPTQLQLGQATWVGLGTATNGCMKGAGNGPRHGK